MFFVIDKSKIISYAVAICTVVILFIAASGLNSTIENENSVMTSGNAIESNSITNNITNKI